MRSFFDDNFRYTIEPVYWGINKILLLRTEEVRQMMIDFDEDGNEVIDFQEFCKMMKAHNDKIKCQPDRELRNALQ